MVKAKKSKSSRAGLDFPIHQTHKLMRARFRPKYRLQKGVAVLVTAYANYMVDQLIQLASEKVTKGKYIKSTDLHKAMIEHPAFPNHATGLY